MGGGAGFIGSALVRALGMRGDQVSVLARRPADVGRKFGPDVEALEWHPPHTGPWMDAFNDADAVVNLAGAPVVEPLKPWTAKQKAVIYSSRIDSTAAIVRAIERTDPRPRVFVSQSAIGYYGSRGSTILTEQSPPGDDFIANLVKDWEAAARPVEELGVRLVTPRTSIVLGTDGGILPQFVMPFKLFLGGTMGYPKQWFSWIHLEDEIDLIVHSLTHEQVSGPINAAAPNPVTMEVLSREIGKVLGKPSWVPFTWLFIKLFLGQRAQAVLASQRVIPDATLASGYIFRHAQIGEALRSLLAPDKSTAGKGPYTGV